MTRIIAVGNAKGGSGKSTLACPLAGYLAAIRKKKVLLVDTDVTSSASTWAEWRSEQGFEASPVTIQLFNQAVATQVVALRGKFDFVIIDIGGTDTASMRSALLVSDTLLMPARPGAFDMASFHKTLQVIEEGRSVNPNLRVSAVLNAASANKARRAKEIEAAQAFFKKHGIELLDSVLGNRVVFMESLFAGSFVPEDSSNADAVAEMTSLIKEIKL